MAGTEVQTMLARAADRPGTSALDAVMGEDWAHLKLGNPMRALRAQFLLRQQTDRTRRRSKLAIEVMAGRPQAMVKLIPTGGAQSARGLRDQMAYLSRNGSVPLERSERYFGAQIEDDQVDQLVQQWGFDREGPMGSDRTTHFIVSFPIGTDREAAARAGREWADEMFGSGRFGDVWDYYTAEHRDTDYPHTHVVVARRGMEEGQWLKVSRRSEMNWDVLREVQVEVARTNGIYLEASPRLARGLHDRPVPDAEMRRAREEGRAVEPPRHNAESATTAAAAVVHYARLYARHAAQIADDHPALSAKMAAAAKAMAEGRAVQEANPDQLVMTEKEETEMAEALDRKKEEVVRGFRDIDRELSEVANPVDRAKLQRQSAELKADAARWMPENEALQAYNRPAAGQTYSSGTPDTNALIDTDEEKRRALSRTRLIIREAQVRVARLGRDAGVDPDAQAERWSGGRVSEGLARDFERDELAERKERRGQEPPEQARRELSELRKSVAGIYDDANRRIAALSRDDAGTGRDAEGTEERRAARDGSAPAEANRRLDEDRRLDEVRRRHQRERQRGRDDDDGFGL